MTFGYRQGSDTCFATVEAVSPMCNCDGTSRGMTASLRVTPTALGASIALSSNERMEGILLYAETVGGARVGSFALPSSTQYMRCAGPSTTATITHTQVLQSDGWT